MTNNKLWMGPARNDSQARLACRAGQSLIEVVVALALATMLAISLVATTLLVQRSSRNARNNTQASKLVLQSIEGARIFRDRNVCDLATPPNCGFDAIPASGCFKFTDPLSFSFVALPSCPPLFSDAEQVTQSGTVFARWVSFTGIGVPPTEKKVTVTVSWNDSSGTQQVSNSTFLSKPCSGPIGAGGCN